MPRGALPGHTRTGGQQPAVTAVRTEGCDGTRKRNGFPEAATVPQAFANVSGVIWESYCLHDAVLLPLAPLLEFGGLTAATPLGPSPLDLLSAILAGSLGGDGLPPGAGSVAAIAENRQLLAIVTTSIAVLVGCALIFFFRRSSGKKPAEPPKPLVVRVQPEVEVDDGKKKVTVFFGTQTGTAEGFAKVVDEMLTEQGASTPYAAAVPEYRVVFCNPEETSSLDKSWNLANGHAIHDIHHPCR
ncbi:hypothetical protein GW17_00053968 [Ensete ventricosum]|nr:hypothetical protein GW17_00053968 [Ensete ventricosum]